MEGAVNRVRVAFVSDGELVQIVDQAMAEAVRKSGSWIACRAGCYECCIGPFAITRLDAMRLRHGLAELEAHEPERAARILARARASVDRLRREFPHDPLQSVLTIDDAAEDEPCPALDPATGACDLYAARPITCRTFGPAVRFSERADQSLAVCELCYHGATEDQIAACAVEVDPDNLESKLLQKVEDSVGPCGDTTVAFALTE